MARRLLHVRWPRGRTLLAGVLGMTGAFGGGLAWMVFGSSLLAVTDIEVAGQQRVARSAIVAAAAVPAGKPLARIDTSAVATRVSGLRVVGSAQVQRAWPSTLRIRVHERVPVAAVPSGSTYVLLDREGVRVATAGRPPANLPTVRIEAAGRATAPDAAADDDRSGREIASRTALSVVSNLPAGLSGKVAAVVVHREQHVTMRMRGGATVIWGAPARAAEKARALQSLLQRVNAHTYNVSSPDVVTTK